MYPILWFGVVLGLSWEIQSYIVFLFLALFVFYVLWVERARRDQAFNTAHTQTLALELRLLEASLGAGLSAVVGARVLFVLTQLFSGKAWNELGDWWQGGLVFYGGLFGALAFLFLYSRWRRLAVVPLFNTAAPAIALAHAVGRVGCFLNGCCHGSPADAPWGVTMTDPRVLSSLKGVPIHPVQLYEAALLVVLALLLWRVASWRSRRFVIYLVGYAGIRFAMEFFRGDALRGTWGLFSTSQWISLAIIPLAVFLDFLWRSDHKRSP